MYEKISYDQIYDEHIYMFSLSSVEKIYNLFNFELIDAIPQETHGGSMRYIIKRKNIAKKSKRLIKLMANERKKNVVFMLWGSYAQAKGKMIDRNHHLVLEAPHPSPLSAHRGFFGCRHFSRANEYLVHKNIAPINWFDVE